MATVESIIYLQSERERKGAEGEFTRTHTVLTWERESRHSIQSWTPLTVFSHLSSIHLLPHTVRKRGLRERNRSATKGVKAEKAETNRERRRLQSAHPQRPAGTFNLLICLLYICHCDLIHNMKTLLFSPHFHMLSNCFSVCMFSVLTVLEMNIFINALWVLYSMRCEIFEVSAHC